jgi:hypothetical protein
MKKATSLILGLSLATTAMQVSANDFQAEGQFTYAQEDTDGFKTRNLDFDGTYYLKRVSTRSGPHEEAGFLAKASFIEAGYSSIGGDAASDSVINVGGRFVTDANFFAGLSYFKQDKADVDALRAEVGTYTSDSTAALLHYTRTDTTFEVDTIGLGYKAVMDQGGATSIGLEAAWDYFRVKDSKNFNTIAADLNYYMTREMHVGVTLSHTPTDGHKETSYGIEVQTFLDRQFAIGASFERNDPKGGIESDTLSAWIKGRL